MKYKNLSGNTVYLTPSELEDYKFSLYTVKPATNNLNVITGEVTDELKENVHGGVVKFEIPRVCTNRLGIVKCEIHINQGNKMIGSSTFVLDVKQSLVTAFDDELLGDEDFPVLKQLILEIQKASNIDDNNRSKITTYSSDKIENIKENLSSQIKEKANKADVAKISNGTPLFAPSTAQMTDTSRNYVNTTDGYIYINTGGAWSKTNVLYQSTGVQDKSITEEKLSFGTNLTLHTTISKIEFTKVGSDCKVTLISTGNIIFYPYQNGSLVFGSNDFKSPQLEYTVPNWSSLVYDCELKTNSIIAYNNVRPSRHILLASVVEGRVIDGYLLHFYLKLKQEEYENYPNTILATNSVSGFVENDSLYVEQENTYNTAIYIKWNGALRIWDRTGVDRLYDYSDVVAQVGSQKSDRRMLDCIRIEDSKILVLDIRDNTFKIIAVTNFDPLYYIKIAENMFGTLSDGVLFTKAINNQLKDARIDKDFIDNDWLPAIRISENKVLEKQSTSTVNLAMITDTHNEEHLPQRYTFKSMNVLNREFERMNCELLLNTGDTILYGRDDKYIGYEALKDGINKFKYKEKCLYSMGNHDFNGKDEAVNNQPYSSTIHPYQVYNIMGKHLDNSVVWGNKEYMYYYKDLEDYKIRIISLNTQDVPIIDNGSGILKYDPLSKLAFRQNQIDWFVNKALDFSDKGEDKTNWHTLVMCHAPLLNADEGMTANGNITNRDAILRAIYAFKNGESCSYNNASNDEFEVHMSKDFTSQGKMNFIGVFSGHLHLDRHIVKDGINHITTMADYNYKWTDDMPDRVIGDISEIVFDIVTINTTTKKVYMARFGAGEHREFTY